MNVQKKQKQKNKEHYTLMVEIMFIAMMIFSQFNKIILNLNVGYVVCIFIVLNLFSYFHYFLQ